MQKTISIVGWNISDNSFGVTKPYLEYFSQFGQVEILTPRKDIVKTDLLVLPGGPDMNPANYNQVPSFYTGNQDVMKEYFFRNNLPQYIDANTRIFAVCLGFQQLNSFFGGQITQHYPFPYSKERDDAIESIEFTEAANKVYGAKGVTKVNSLHHQGVFEDQLAKLLIPLAISTKEKNVEAFAHGTRRIAAVQWHPEHTKDNFSKMLIESLLDEEE